MQKSRGKYLFLVLVTLALVQCRRPYEPPAVKASNHFLAVDGYINTSPFGITTITLTRSLNLTDSVPILPELNAQIKIKSSDGALFPLVDTGANGVYVSSALTLDPNLQYQITVTTSDGNNYATDLVTPKQAPPVDSLNWELVDDANLASEVLNIYVNAHDVTGNTRYYRWDYVETWQHESPMQTYWGLKDSIEYPIDPGESTFDCWSSGHSNSIILGSSINLTNDVISQALVTSFAKNDPKMDIKYSMLIRQYPLDFNAYKYWLTVQKNSQSLGGLFDIQPSQIDGNFHSLSNSVNPSLGYVSACSVQELRIFISNENLPGWKSNPPEDCPIKIIPSDPDNSLIWNYPDTAWQLWYFVSGPPPTLKITHKDCLDCRFQGGTTTKPPFWQ